MMNMKRRIKRRANPTVLYKKALTVVSREIDRLMDVSYSEKLSQDDARCLIAYMKFLNEAKALHELQQIEAAEKKQQAESHNEEL